MRMRSVLSAALLSVAGLGVVFALQVGFQVPTDYDDDSPIPPDANERTEWAFARLKYPSYRMGRYRRFRGTWTIDYPKSDRQFSQGVRRLTRLNAGSAERVIDLDTDEIFYWPWVYAVEVGHWDLEDRQALRIREYLQRGGFLMVDDFHGTWEWEVFMAVMKCIFPDRQVVDLPDKDAVFHVLYDLDERFQVPGIQYLYSGRTWEQDGIEPRWRGVYDDKGRLMVLICHNMDLGDAWEWADDPRYPEKWASLAYRVGINGIIYAMTH